MIRWCTVGWGFSTTVKNSLVPCSFPWISYYKLLEFHNCLQKTHFLGPESPGPVECCITCSLDEILFTILKASAESLDFEVDIFPGHVENIKMLKSSCTYPLAKTPRAQMDAWNCWWSRFHQKRKKHGLRMYCTQFQSIVEEIQTFSLGRKRGRRWLTRRKASTQN